MFTGLIEEVGTVVAIRHDNGLSRLAIDAPRIGSGCAIGDSVCVSGVCLTVVARTGRRLEFEAIAETLRRSNLGGLRSGARVNLERAMAATSRFGGHIVQGHIDALGKVIQVRPEATSHLMMVEVGPELMRYIVEKGSVALDGISLTVASSTATGFTIAIIPHTWAETTLGERRPGDRVNLEADIVAKYVERLLLARLESDAAPGSNLGLSAAVLREHGFA